MAIEEYQPFVQEAAECIREAMAITAAYQQQAAVFLGADEPVDLLAAQQYVDD